MSQQQDLKAEMPTTRGYQQEMLDESLRRNIVIALDTGSGKTHIAVLRMKMEIEREGRKISWFLAPTVSLCEQQKDVIAAALPVPVGIISGALEPDQWKDAQLWQTVLSSHRIMVSTPQVLLDALRHGYVNLGRDISLLVFDEAHHAADKHPYNMIMREFYLPCPQRNALGLLGRDPMVDDVVRPSVLGLTASPIFGGNIQLAFKTIEANLDSTIISPRHTRAELAQHVHRPTFKHAVYPILVYPDSSKYSASPNVVALGRAVATLDINSDPSVLALRSRLARMQRGSADWIRADQKLSKMVVKKETFVSKGLRDFERAAVEICVEVGVWAAEWYVWNVVQLALRPRVPKGMDIEGGEEEDSESAPFSIDSFFLSRNSAEKDFLLTTLRKVLPSISPPTSTPTLSSISDKTRTLISVLLSEKSACEAAGDAYSGLVFVTRRDAVLALAATLSACPQTSAQFRIGRLLGTSESSKRHSFLDITRALVPTGSQSATLRGFRLGETNLLVCTAVAEEGLDVQACGSVVRWDRPMNMVSWAQSRGRARKKRSAFVVLVEGGAGSGAGPGPGGTVNVASGLGEVAKWERMEAEMAQWVQDERRLWAKVIDMAEEQGTEEGEEYLEFRVSSTGAVVTLDSAISHLAHFCAILPTTSHTETAPIYDTFPPDYPPEFHAIPLAKPIGANTHLSLSLSQPSLPEPNPGPFGATVSLPRQLPPNLRTHSVPRKYVSKQSARRHAAFTAYVALYEAGLLSENLLPPDDDLKLVEEEVRKALEDVEKREGMVGVKEQIDPLVADGDGAGEDVWWESDVYVEGLPVFRLFTCVEIPVMELTDRVNDAHFGPRRFTFKTKVKRTKRFATKEKAVAQEYTRMLLSVLYGTRMKWDNLDFQYLLLPPAHLGGGTTWAERRVWADGARNLDSKPQTHFRFVANAQQFGEHYSHPSDIAVLVDFTKRQFFKFIRWRMNALSEEEEERVRVIYGRKVGEIEIQYPVIEAEVFSKRMNFLHPLPKDFVKGEDEIHSTILLPEHTGVVLLSEAELKFSLFFPSLVRSLKVHLTAHAVRTALFPPSLQDTPLSLVRQSISAPVAQEHHNYQRLELLGDTILKFITDVQLLDIYPLWHEGYLTKKKDHLVSNASLAKTAIGRRVYKWIVRNTFLAKKWVPDYARTDTIVASVKDEESSAAEDNGADKFLLLKKRKKNDQLGKLSTKVLADVVEAIIGAVYLHGGFAASVAFVGALGVGDIAWVDISQRVESILRTMSTSFSQASVLSRSSTGMAGREYEPIPPTEALPPINLSSLRTLSPTLPTAVTENLAHVERMIGHTFQHAFLLVEALMHASCQSELASSTVSYERMEFLGDSVLDVVVTNYLFHAAERQGKMYGPGHIHIRKSALVNMHFLAYICLRTHVKVDKKMPKWEAAANKEDGSNFKKDPRGKIKITHDTQPIHLWQCLLHSSPQILDDQRDTFARFTRDHSSIERSLMHGHHFPWADLTRLQAPKFLSDIVEAILGAVFLDSHGDMGAVERVLEKLGIMELLRRIVKDDVDVRHPVTRLANWAAKSKREREERAEEQRVHSGTVDDPPQQTPASAAAGEPSKANANGIEYRYSRGAGQITCTIEVDGRVVVSISEIYRGKASQDEVRFRASEQAIRILSKEFDETDRNF